MGDSGSIGVSIAGWDGARLGVPGSSLTSSDPEVLAVHSDGTYEALQEGTAEVRITPYLLRNGETRPAGEALNQTVAALVEDRAPARLSASLPPSLPFWELGPKFCGRWVSGNKNTPPRAGCGGRYIVGTSQGPNQRCADERMLSLKRLKRGIGIPCARAKETR